MDFSNSKTRKEQLLVDPAFKYKPLILQGLASIWIYTSITLIGPSRKKKGTKLALFKFC